MKHKTVRVRVGRMDAMIDVMIAPLIKRLWQLGIYTLNSCQENKPGVVWIQFMSPEDATEFLDVAAILPSQKDLTKRKFWDTMYCRMTRGGFGEWEYDCRVDNMGEERGQVYFNFIISIRFPQTDLPAIIQAFENGLHVRSRLRRLNAVVPKQS